MGQQVVQSLLLFKRTRIQTHNFAHLMYQPYKSHKVSDFISSLNTEDIFFKYLYVNLANLAGVAVIIHHLYT
jgi:hypothetical protein